jgi:hypothetical protein
VSSTVEHAIRETLGGIENAFAPNELAYLAATTKIELPFRDRLAYLLHRRLEPAGILVAREWRRIDLAILAADGVPTCLLELKAMYTFDAFGENLAFFTQAMSADEQKGLRQASPDIAVYTMLLATHLDGAVDRRFSRIVKYDGGINKGIDDHGSAVALRQRAEQNVQSALAGHDVVATGRGWRRGIWAAR